MNAAEHIVELYFRHLDCFTVSDIKVIHGHNRQFDILALNGRTKEIRHIEVSVHPDPNWEETVDTIKGHVRYKFFGIPSISQINSRNSNTSRGKNYLDNIKDTYLKYGVKYEDVIRVCCTWDFPILSDSWKDELAAEFGLNSNRFEILKFRDTILSELQKNIGTANYDNEILRLLSLINSSKVLDKRVTTQDLY